MLAERLVTGAGSPRRPDTWAALSSDKKSPRRQLSLITVDQAIAGGSNVLIAVLAARLLDAASFGLFGIVFLLYVMAQGVSRALVCDPLLVHPVEAEERKREVIGTSGLLGLALGFGVILIGLAMLLVDDRLGAALIVLGGFLPLLVLQDLGRYLAFAAQRPTAALTLDVTWLVLLVGAVVPLFVTDTESLAWFIAAWAGSGAVAGLLLFVQHRGLGVRLGLDWLRYTWGFSWRYLISYMATQGGALAGSSAVGAIAGARALGGVQGAILLVRPFMTFQIAVIAASIGHVTRSLGAEGAIRRHVAGTTVITTAAAAANLAVMLVLPDSAGEAVLGDSWEVAEPLLLATGVQIVFLGLMTGARAGLLGMRAIRQVMRIDVMTTALVLIASIVGAVINGALGALWAVAIVQALVALVIWITFLGRTPQTDAEAAPPAEALPATAPTPPAA
jgi:O-antigen/teichoic acid export membrane protein